MQTVIIGVDVGYGNTKTSNVCFSSGIRKLPGRPPVSTRVVEAFGNFYAIGNGKLSVQRSKTDNEDMLILSMAAIAEELRRRSINAADVHLGVGVPLTRMGAEKQTFTDYYGKEMRLLYKYEDVLYDVRIVSCDVFPQGYAGVVSYMKDFRQSALVIDIGSWTVDILPLTEYIPDLTRCKSLPQGTITCMNDINEALRQKLGQDADETTLKDVMMTGTADIPADYLSVIKTGLISYAGNLLDQIRALNFNSDLTQFVFIGGGASIMKNFLPEADMKKAMIIDDIHINAKGYEELIRHKRGGADK